MIETIDLKKVLFEDVQGVNSKIEEILERISNEKLKEAASHILRAGGKRIRPAVMLTSYKALGGQNIESALSVAAALEIIHNWTLIHDDIIDESDLRRGVDTVHKRWDHDVAILTGDMLNNLAYEAVCLSGFDAATTNRINCIISRASMQVIDGEMMDVEFEQRTDLSEDDYFKMIALKTGALFESSARIGAVMAAATSAQEAALGSYGSNIGLAFQVQDDLLDIIADQKQFGKEVGKDIKEGKRTLMVLHALNHATVSDSNELAMVLDKENNSSDEVSRAVEILHQSGSIEYAQTALQMAVDHSVEDLAELPENHYCDILVELAHYIRDRKK